MSDLQTCAQCGVPHANAYATAFAYGGGQPGTQCPSYVPPMRVSVSSRFAPKPGAPKPLAPADHADALGMRRLARQIRTGAVSASAAQQAIRAEISRLAKPPKRAKPKASKPPALSPELKRVIADATAAAARVQREQRDTIDRLARTGVHAVNAERSITFDAKSQVQTLGAVVAKPRAAAPPPRSAQAEALSKVMGVNAEATEPGVVFDPSTGVQQFGVPVTAIPRPPLSREMILAAGGGS